MHSRKKNTELLFYLAVLTGFFLLFEISLFIQSNKAYLGDFSFVTEKMQIPLTVLPGIVFFLFAQCLLHIAYCLLIWCVTLLVAGFLRTERILMLGVLIWLMGSMAILVTNQYFYPNSHFADLTSIFLTAHVLNIVWLVLVFSCGAVLMLALMELIIILYKISLLGMLSIALISFIAAWLYVPAFTPGSPATAERPNIIIVGIDALRPDFLGYFGSDLATPFLDNMLGQATVFGEAVTPLARTFPAWTSILTGLYPLQTKVRFDLASQQEVDFTQTLPAILQRQGYETIFATDETRFSNIDTNAGFDKRVTPPIGLNDFLLGTFNDFPLSNLVVNTKLGSYLFPYSYGNRPAFVTYEPDRFLDLLRPALLQQHQKPVFLAAHFCLTHFPYLWASYPAADHTMLERYQASVERVDRQVHDLFALLQQSGLLNHALVVLLSDHGEALALPGDRITEQDLFIAKAGARIPAFYPPSLDYEAVNQSAGHGTDVLGLSQYHTLLAFKSYGSRSIETKVVPGVVSLLAIKPTILDLLGLQQDPASLAPIMLGQQAVIKPQHIFLESDFSPAAIRTVHPEIRQVLLEGIQLFQIDPVTTRLTLKEKMGQMIIDSKQYADIYGDWVLALYPQQKDRIAVLVNLKTGQWTVDMTSSFALVSPARTMMAALQAFYHISYS